MLKDFKRFRIFTEWIYLDFGLSVVWVISCYFLFGFKPEIQVFPNKVVKKGGNVTIRCSCPNYQGIFRLSSSNTKWYKDGEENKHEQNFTVTNVTENDSDFYCLHHTTILSWSEKSDTLTLKVIDPHKPKISAYLQDDLHKGKQILITCTAPEPPEECSIIRFYLYSGKVRIRDLTFVDRRQVNFTPVSYAKYRCSYDLKVKEPPLHIIESPLSEGVKPKKYEETNNPEEEAEENTEKIGTEQGVLNLVVATICGILIVLLIVMFAIYFKRKKKSSPQKMKNSNFGQSGQVENMAEATYCTVDRNMMTRTPDVEVDLTDTGLGDYNGDGIIYAKLNPISPRQKNTQSNIATDTSIYAEVKKTTPKIRKEKITK
ncbi:uncharacterized protein [Engystomops pustulosus]|uniref:uncharacterized protein n=1 Tax=Engystomops pustulosus TaxID=76066 RepID=UPI003AFB2375